MTTVLEHDYIGLSSEVSSMERKTSSAVEDDDDKSLVNLKETELRLGLPGCESPERKQASLGLFPLFGKDHSSGKNFAVSGAKRGFSDVSGKWVFNEDGGSESELGKAAVLFSPRGGKNGIENGNKSNTCQQNCGVSSTSPSKEAVLSKEKIAQQSNGNEHGAAPSSKAQVVGWPPIRSFRKNSMASTPAKNNDEPEGKSGSGCLYVKVSMDGAPYLRKVDLKTYNNYTNLSSALEKMFSCFTIGKCGSHGAPGRDGLSESCLMDFLHGSEYVLTYEDKDGDWMLVGDVPWGMFTETCRRLRIMKGSDAIGLAPRAMEKCKNRN